MGKRNATTRATSRATAAHPAADQFLYLYAVLEAGTEAERVLAAGQVPGLDPAEPLFPIACANLVAAVSRVSAAVFGEEPLNALLGDLPRLAPYVVQHEAAIRALLPHAPALVPLTFGAVYTGPERVVALLQEQADRLRQALDLVRDRQEWGLKVFLDDAQARAAAERASPALRELEAAAAAEPPGKAYLLRKRREQLRAGEAARLAQERLELVLDRLGALSAAARQDPLPTEPTGSPRLVCKAAFLVARADGPAFQAVAAGLEPAAAAAGLRLELSGPWAPYSFVGGRHGAA